MFHALIPTTRSRLLAGLMAISMMVASAAGARADNHISSTGAAILGGVAGLAIGAAIADSNNHRPVYYPPRYAQPYPPPYAYQPAYAQPYQPAYAQPYPAYYPRYARPFSPAPGVTCNPGRGLCFNDSNGTVASRWTSRVFGG